MNDSSKMCAQRAFTAKTDAVEYSFLFWWQIAIATIILWNLCDMILSLCVVCEFVAFAGKIHVFNICLALKCTSFKNFEITWKCALDGLKFAANTIAVVQREFPTKFSNDNDIIHKLYTKKMLRWRWHTVMWMQQFDRKYANN